MVIPKVVGFQGSFRTPGHVAPDSESRLSKGQRTRERILEVAEELIAQHGVEGFELKDVATRVGIRSPSIFAHFKGREDLAEAVARRVGQRIVDQFDIAGTDPEKILRKAVRNLVAHLAEHPAHVRILLADLVRHRELHQLTGSAEHVLRAGARVGALLQNGCEKGVFRKVRLDTYIAFVLGGILSSLAWYGWDEQGRPQGPLSLPRLQRDAEDLAVRFLWPARDEVSLARGSEPFDDDTTDE
jgi:AcrR family transcriptional regulator